MDLSAVLALLPAVLDMLKNFGPLGLVVFGVMIGANKLQIPSYWRAVLPLVLGVLIDGIWQVTHGTPLNTETIAKFVQTGFGGGATSTVSYQIFKHLAEKYPSVVGTVFTFVK